MPVERDALRAFLLRQKGKPELIDSALQLLEPIFEKMDSGIYQLSPASEVTAEVLTTIAWATGQAVRNVTLISAAAPSPRPEWMTQQVYAEGFPDALAPLLYASLRQEHFGWEHLEVSFPSRMGTERWEHLRETFGQAVRGLYEILVETFGERLVGQLQYNFKTCLEDVPQFLLGFAILGDASGIGRLASFIDLLPKALPLGAKKDDAETWLVLVA